MLYRCMFAVARMRCACVCVCVCVCMCFQASFLMEFQRFQLPPDEGEDFYGGGLFDPFACTSRDPDDVLVRGGHGISTCIDII